MARRHATTSATVAEPAMEPESPVEGASEQQPETTTQEATQALAELEPVEVEKTLDAAPLKPGGLQGGEFARMQWVVEIEPGVDPGNLTVPAFWAHVAARLQPYHEIVARTKDRSWWAHLLVVDCGPQWATVRFIAGPIDLDVKGAKTSQLGEYMIAYEGLSLGWTVRRKSDSAVMERGLTTRSLALSAAIALMTRQAA